MMCRIVKNMLYFGVLRLVVLVNCQVYQQSIKFSYKDWRWDEDMVMIDTAIMNRLRQEERAIEQLSGSIERQKVQDVSQEDGNKALTGPGIKMVTVNKDVCVLKFEEL